MARLVKAWNRLPEVTPVERFTDRRTGILRIWKAIQTVDGPAPEASDRYTLGRRARGARIGGKRLRDRQAKKSELVLQLNSAAPGSHVASPEEGDRLAGP